MARRLTTSELSCDLSGSMMLMLGRATQVQPVAAVSQVHHQSPGGHPRGMPIAAVFWIVFFAVLDVSLTWMILTTFAHMGGREVNYFAQAIIEQFGFGGAVVLKIWCVALAIVAHRCVALRNTFKAKQLSAVLIIISAMPVVVAAWNLAILD